MQEEERSIWRAITGVCIYRGQIEGVGYSREERRCGWVCNGESSGEGECDAERGSVRILVVDKRCARMLPVDKRCARMLHVDKRCARMLHVDKRRAGMLHVDKTCAGLIHVDKGCASVPRR